jgi:hypothetical protein
MRYEPPAINFHLQEPPPREPQGGGEQTEFAARADSFQLDTTMKNCQVLQRPLMRIVYPLLNEVQP